MVDIHSKRVSSAWFASDRLNHCCMEVEIRSQQGIAFKTPVDIFSWLFTVLRNKIDQVLDATNKPHA